MHLLKSLYISLYITASMAGTGAAIFMLATRGFDPAWLGAAIACAAPLGFFAVVFTLPIARTSPNLNALLAAGVAGTAISAASASPWPWPALLAGAVGVAGTLLYVYWYSRFDAPVGSVLRVGNVLPAFPLVEHGNELESAALTSRPALWIFYRGNWCPLCVAQIREICDQYRALADRGIEVFLVSPQPETNNASLAGRCDAPLRFLMDRGNRAAARLGILHRNGLPAGMQMFGYDSDVPRPTVFITDSNGKVVFCDMTDNYRVRPEPSQYLPILDQMSAA